MTTAYTKTNVEGKTLNQRTAELHYQTKRIYRVIGGTGEITIAQGSYNTGVGASAGTHDGGGAIDWNLTEPSPANWKKLQDAARWAQFAAWWRKPLYRNGKKVWGDHVHGIVVGDTSATTLAENQVADYKAKPPRDGLASNNVDNTWHPRKIFTPSYPMWDVSLSLIVKESKKTWLYKTDVGVKSVQQALNLKLGLSLKVDGRFGKSTKAAYKQWQYECDKYFNYTTKHDGIPTYRTLVLLGAGRFNVK